MAYKLFSSSDNVSNEMIDEQLNDKVVTDLTSKFLELIDLTDRFSNKLPTNVSYFRFSETKKVIDEIDKIIFERFNIKTKHISADGIGYAVLTVPPTNFNVLAGDVVDVFDYFKNYLAKDRNEYEVRPEVTERDVKNIKNIKDIFKDEKSVVYHTYMSYIKLEDTLKSSLVNIDLKKAKINNLPKEYNIFVMVDLIMLIRKFKLTGRELTAVLLHEIGHSFTHLEYSYRSVKNTSLILDTIRDNISNGKSKIETFNIAYNKILNGNEDLTKVNEYTACLKLIDKYMESTIILNMDDKHSFSDSEQLADQFSNRFGLGDALSSALVKLHGDANRVPRKPMMEIFISTIMIAILIASLIFASILLPIFLIYIVSVILVGGPNSNEITYDTKLRRYQRIRNDMVKILRTIDLDKSIIKNLLEEIAIVDKIIDRTTDDVSLLDKIADRLMPYNNKITKYKKMEELLEDMSENNLYIASNKLKMLNK